MLNLILMLTSEEIKTGVDIFQGAVTSLGIVAAAVWSLFTFGLGRAFAPNIHFQFHLKQSLSVNEVQCVILSLKLKNVGRTRVRKKSCTLTLLSILPEVTKDGHDTREFRRLDLAPDEMVNHLPRRFEIFAEHDAFEPNEEATEDILLEQGQSPVFKTSAVFFGRKYMWGREQYWASSAVLDARKAEPQPSAHTGGTT